MESHEVLRNAFKETSPKAVASELGVSLSLVYKWAQEQSELGSGSKNPIDRLLQIYELTQHRELIEFLAHQCGGYFVPHADPSEVDTSHYLPATNKIVSQFSDLLSRIAHAASDNSITTDEAEELRTIWNQLKGHTEGFIRCCEEGNFEAMHEISE